jgi:hypothetical protein
MGLHSGMDGAQAGGACIACLLGIASCTDKIVGYECALYLHFLEV